MKPRSQSVSFVLSLAIAPQFYGEWYPHYIYDKNDSGDVYPHHLSTYGDPFADWPYDKFITG